MNLGLINKILAGFIITMCVVLSCFLLFTDFMAESISGTKRTVFVLVLIGYAVYRSYRLFRSKQENI